MFDFIIKNGFVVDGSGYPGIRQDIAIKDGRIAKVAADICSCEGHKVIDASGLVVTPGFIDAHSHADWTLSQNRRAESAIRQGITTVMAGQCGSSVAPLSEKNRSMFERDGNKTHWSTIQEFFSYLEEDGIGINIAMLLGQGTVRGYVMGTEDREPTDKEMKAMKDLVHQAMQAGTFGISSGRRYMPGCLASEKEVIELCKVASEYGGIYMSHIYNQDAQILSSIEDLIEVGRQAKMPVQLVHQKVCGKVNWGNAPKTLAMMEEARAEGVDILSDIYPYYFTQISDMKDRLPEWAIEGTTEELVRSLREQATADRIVSELEQFAEKNPVRYGSLLQTGVVWCKNTKEIAGMSCAEIMEQWGVSYPNMIIRILIENEGEVLTAGIMGEEDIQSIIKHRYSMIGTDSLVYDGPGERRFLHPRNYGTYPYVLEHYVRETPLLKLEEAIHKMTGMPAKRFGFGDRGLLQEGCAADIVVMDLENVRDRASIDTPYQYPDGIEYVWVNGKLTLEKGEYHPCLAGKALRKN